VTRVWFTTVESHVRVDGDFPDSVHVILVGSGEVGGSKRMSPDRFFEQIERIEAHRAGDPVPTLA
jgi:hypothetical protein